MGISVGGGNPAQPPPCVAFVADMQEKQPSQTASQKPSKDEFPMLLGDVSGRYRAEWNLELYQLDDHEFVRSLYNHISTTRLFSKKVELWTDDDVGKAFWMLGESCNLIARYPRYLEEQEITVLRTCEVYLRQGLMRKGDWFHRVRYAMHELNAGIPTFVRWTIGGFLLGGIAMFILYLLGLVTIKII